MKRLEELINRIIDRTNVNLREPAFDVGPYVRGLIPLGQFTKFYAFYGLTSYHPLHFHFQDSSLAGSYFLGKCIVDNSVLYKSDIRGDELKLKGDSFRYHGLQIPLHDDEVIRIKDSYLIKNLVHSYSHDPENPEEFCIQNTVSMHYANIHGAPVEGSFLGPFATVDLTTLHDSVIGSFCYIQTEELAHQMVEPGRIWIRSEGNFDFDYRFPPEVLSKYIRLESGKVPKGIFMDFAESRKKDFEWVFSVVQSKPPIALPRGASLSKYAVVRGNTEISGNVLVAQRAYLEDAWLGKGSNAQENCYIIQSRLEGLNITAHGAKIIHACLGEKVFVGFNAFLRAGEGCGLRIGRESIVMPHTIIDLEEPMEIPDRHLLWGYIRNNSDLKDHSIGLQELEAVDGSLQLGALRFQGSGKKFVHGFQRRIEHILEANGACCDGARNRGHAQKTQNITFNIIQPYPEGPRKGLYPSIDILP